MNKQEIISYSEIRDKLSTFTIINCEHKELFYRLIGHTAVVYRCVETGQVMVFESNIGVGVRLTPMGKWLNEYNGKVFVRIPTFFAMQSQYGSVSNPEPYHSEIKLAQKFVKKHLGSSYPNVQTLSGKMKLLLAAFDLKVFEWDMLTYDGDDEGIFCTMLVIMFLRYCGLLGCLNLSQKKRVIPAHEYEPDDTRGRDVFDKYLINCKYGKEIQIK